jgi:hypothetical protein
VTAVARELQRVDQGDGTHLVHVAVDNTTINYLVVPTEMMDTPGYLDMIEVMGVRHDNLLRIREGLGRR